MSIEESRAPGELNPEFYRKQADVCRTAGDELAALANLIAARMLDAFAAQPSVAQTRDLCDVATGYFMKGDHEAAAHWYRLVLAIDPDTAVAWLNLAAIHAKQGDEHEAAACRERAYKSQRVFIEQTGGETRRVLILCSGSGTGNVPFAALLPGTVNCRIKYAIDHALDDEDANLPPFDLVFNALGDPDVAEPIARRLARFESRSSRPVLNRSAVVARTRRHRLPELLYGLSDVVSAHCVLGIAPSAAEQPLAPPLADNGLTFPLLLRPVASHGGDGLVRCDDLDTLNAHLRVMDSAHYLSAFHDTCDADGFYRKYRMIFIDGEPFPYHLAISPHWMVHYFSANMEAHAWKLDEERRFLADPRDAIGDRALRAIANIGERLALDYAGIDFTILPDGRVFVFEANATMLVHYERDDGPLKHKNAHVQRIADAFEQMMMRRSLSDARPA
jgi:tetratricopeptide (TPR) repeat protein